jgi:membrane fusion protein, multidrug efflux system
MKAFNQNYIICTTLLLLLLTISCNKGLKEKNAELNNYKVELAKLKNDKDAINTKIRTLETTIEKLDSNIAEANNAKLVQVDTIFSGNFSHYIELQGKIDADNISYISPRGMGGQVKQIFVRKGDFVKVGTPVLRLDNAILNQNIIAARKGLETIKVQQALAKTLYERQKNLWEQNIGAEIQVIQAKSNVDALQSQLNAAEAGVKTADEQMKTSMVYSDVTGYIDDMNIKVGELFAGATAFGPQIKVINTSSLKTTVNIPENYIGRVSKGSSVVIFVPDLNTTINGVITFTSMSVDPNQRGFIAEIKIPYDSRLKPNLLAQVKILDYAANSAVTVPINVVQNDDKGKYIYVAERSSNGKITAAKRQINVGAFFGDRVEVKNGLNNSDLIITEGYQNIYEGQILKLDK